MIDIIIFVLSCRTGNLISLAFLILLDLKYSRYILMIPIILFYVVGMLLCMYCMYMCSMFVIGVECLFVIITYMYVTVLFILLVELI